MHARVFAGGSFRAMRNTMGVLCALLIETENVDAIITLLL